MKPWAEKLTLIGIFVLVGVLLGLSVPRDPW